MAFDIAPEDLKARMDSGEKVQILDVREASELAIASIGAIHIPLGQLPARYQELNPDQEIFVLCHHGVRAANATVFLRSQGLNAINIRGGIDRW